MSTLDPVRILRVFARSASSLARIRTHKSVNGEQLSGVRARQVVAD